MGELYVQKVCGFTHNTIRAHQTYSAVAVVAGYALIGNPVYDTVMWNLFIIDTYTLTIWSIPTVSYFFSICHGGHATLKICPYAFTIIIIGRGSQTDRLDK